MFTKSSTDGKKEVIFIEKHDYGDEQYLLI